MQSYSKKYNYLYFRAYEKSDYHSVNAIEPTKDICNVRTKPQGKFNSSKNIASTLLIDNPPTQLEKISEEVVQTNNIKSKISLVEKKRVVRPCPAIKRNSTNSLSRVIDNTLNSKK